MKTAIEFLRWQLRLPTYQEQMEAIEARDREVAVKILRDAATVAYAKNLRRAHSFLLDRAERAERGE